jgi:hypothetical protein
MIQMNTKVNFDTSAILKKHAKATEKAQFLLDQQVVKDSNLFIPLDTAELRDSSLIQSDFGSGNVGWFTPYARRLYYNPQYNFSTDRNSQAQGLWFEAAKAQYGEEWVAMARNELMRGFKA